MDGSPRKHRASHANFSLNLTSTKKMSLCLVPNPCISLILILPALQAQECPFCFLGWEDMQFSGILVLWDATLQHLLLSHLPHHLSWDLCSAAVAPAIWRFWIVAQKPLKGWPAQVNIIDQSSTISTAAARESQAGEGSHWEQGGCVGIFTGK